MLRSKHTKSLNGAAGNLRLPEAGLMTNDSPSALTFRTLLAAAQIPALVFTWCGQIVPEGGSFIKTFFLDSAKGAWRELGSLPPRHVSLPPILRTGVAAALRFAEYMTDGAVTGASGRERRQRARPLPPWGRGRGLYFIPGGAWTGARMIAAPELPGLLSTSRFLAEDTLSAEEMSGALKRYMERAVLLAAADPRLWDGLAWSFYKMTMALGTEIPFPLPGAKAMTEAALSENFPPLDKATFSKVFGMGSFS